jgi:predicted anti-sigma-YlaC factor YlaD
MDKKRALWQLLCENPSDLTCEECFAVMEFYAGVLATTGPGILAKVLEHLKACPTCRAEYGETLRRLMAAQSQDNGASQPGVSESDGSDQEE